jgi:hypothetical protein
MPTQPDSTSPCSAAAAAAVPCSEVLDSQWAPSKFSKAFAWSQVHVTGLLTWPNAAFTFLAFPALSYKFGELPCPTSAQQHVQL